MAKCHQFFFMNFRGKGKGEAQAQAVNTQEGKWEALGQEWASYSAAPRGASRSSYLKLKENVWDFIDTFSGSNRWVCVRIWRLIRTRHFLILLREFEFTVWYSMNCMSFRVTQDSKSSSSTCGRGCYACQDFPLPECHTCPQLLGMLAANYCLNCPMLQTIVLSNNGKFSPGSQRLSAWYKKNLSLWLQVDPNAWSSLWFRAAIGWGGLQWRSQTSPK